MLKPDLPTIARLMRRAPQEGMLQVFPFQPQDVEGIYTQKIGEGVGVWFRLKDGRVFDARGRLAEPDPACYGETEAH